MTTALSKRNCPFDLTELEIQDPGGGRRHWVCPTCDGRWMHEAAAELNAAATRDTGRGETGTPTGIRRFRDAPDHIADATFDSFRTSRNAFPLTSQPPDPPSQSDGPLADAIALGESAPHIETRLEQILPDELFYDSIAADFDRIMNRYDLRRRLETVYDVFLGDVDLTGCRLLDAGCGTGWFSLHACRRGADVTALDIGPRLLAQVRRKCGATTVRGDVLEMQFEDGRFDVVISSECIEHTRHPQQAVRELVRVCRPGGLIVITSNNRFWYWLCALADRLRLRPYEGIENWPAWTQLLAWVDEAGGWITEKRGIHLFPFQIRLFHPILRFLDRFGKPLGPFCVNQAVMAVKSC